MLTKKLVIMVNTKTIKNMEKDCTLSKIMILTVAGGPSEKNTGKEHTLILTLIE